MKVFDKYQTVRNKKSIMRFQTVDATTIILVLILINDAAHTVQLLMAGFMYNMNIDQTRINKSEASRFVHRAHMTRVYQVLVILINHMSTWRSFLNFQLIPFFTALYNIVSHRLYSVIHHIIYVSNRF